MMAPGGDECLASESGQIPSEADYKWNIRRVFTALFFVCSLTAVTLGPLFDAYLLNIGGTNGNSLVGAVESTRGLLQLAVAYPIGALSDRMSRVHLLKWDLPIWMAGLCLVLAGVQYRNVPLICVGVAVWGPCSQCWNSTAQVVVADSVLPGTRTAVTANMVSVRLVGSSVGPLLQVVMLLILREDHWGDSLLRTVLTAGALLWPGVLIWTCLLRDLPPLERAMASRDRQGSQCFRLSDLDHRVYGLKTRWWAAGGLELISLITAVGAGMTVKFFPLFFRVDYHFTPLQVCILTFTYPLCIALMAQFCRWISGHLGRLQAVMLFHALATACLWALCFTHSVFFVVPLYLVRGALMNSRTPIVRAMIMDLVSTDMRGRWNSIQSMSTFTWSGSAALGGFLADVGGDYRFTFIITAMVYTLSGLLTLLLFFVFPAEHLVDQQSVTAPLAQGSPAIQSSPSLVAPTDTLDPSAPAAIPTVTAKDPSPAQENRDILGAREG